MIKKVGILFITLTILSTFYHIQYVFAVQPTSVFYQTYISNADWQPSVANGDVSGSTGKNLSIEAIKIQVQGVTVKYQVYVKNAGWLDSVQTPADSNDRNDEIAGIIGQDKAIEAIKIQLEGAPEGYRITYQVHVQNLGWLNWVNDGEVAGTIDRNLNIEAIRIRVWNDSYSINSNFNRWGAKVYAEKYASTPNLNYPLYLQGGDCTNFVSQVIAEGGGLSIDNIWYPKSNAWINVEFFMNYWANYDGKGIDRAYCSKTYTIENALNNYDEIYDDLYEGDIIQYTGGLSDMHHSQVVNAYRDGDLYVSQHSDEGGIFNKDINLKSYLQMILNQNGPSVTIRTIKIKKGIT